MSDFWLKVRKTLQYHWKKRLIAIREAKWDRSKPLAQSPVFILGCSRAGTTLVYKTFSESRQLGTLQRETHDLWASLHSLEDKQWSGHELDEADASPADAEFISRYFYSHTGTLQFVDKNNQNGLCLPYLLKLFPKARFVYIKRSPGDNINSLIEGWRKADEFATWSNNLPLEVNVENGQFKRWCFFIAQGWQEYVNESIEKVAAYQYRVINRAILKGRKLVPPSQWVEIRYEDLLVDPVKGFKDAFVDLGLEFDKHLEQHCQSVLSNPYNAFSEIRLDKWKDGRNAEKVASVMASVEDVAKEMGY